MPHCTYAAEMAATATEETPAPSGESDELSVETNEGADEEKEKGLAEPETEEQGTGVEMKMEEADAEAGEEKLAAAADKATSEAVMGDSAATVNQEGIVAPEEPEPKPDSQQSPGEGNDELANGNPLKEAKEEPGEDSRCSVIDCEKSKTVCEDGEKPSGGGGELGDKRRPSVEISSSDGEPLSRMDSEDRLVGEMTGYSGLEFHPATFILSSAYPTKKIISSHTLSCHVLL